MSATPVCPCGWRDGLGPPFLGVGRNGARFHVRLCPSCGRGLLDPRPQASELLSAYDDTYYGRGARKFVQPIQAGIGWFRRRRVRGLLRSLGTSAQGRRRALDIGCGDGEFLAELQRLGWECHGTELTETTARRAASVPGLHIRTGPLEADAYAEGHFDVVSLWHVLEHLADPDRTLRDCGRWLADGGLLLLAVPNLDSWQATLFRGAWFHLDPPFHLFHFDPRSLRRLLEAAGFDVLGIRHLSWHYNPYGVVQSVLNTLGFPRDELYEVLKGNQRLGRSHRIAQVALAALALPAAIGMTLLEAAAGRGGTIEVMARRRALRPGP